MPRTASPFLHPGPGSTANSLAIVVLSRDRLEPIYLDPNGNDASDGYAEGAVLNTRFGSFPHSTLANQPWGSQIRASHVDTGTRGRRAQHQQKKRKLNIEDDTENGATGEDTPGMGSGIEGEQKTAAKKAIAAASGFVHILAPSPELWTMSLPHRTQVVYTPDYSYILQRIRARPGSTIIEAGAGSGSFTHASARAVYNGVPDPAAPARQPQGGRVFSFEFNETRYGKMCTEVAAHKIDDIVRVTHRDVYNDGFLVDGESPGADCVFLDLPAPWKALPHLARHRYKVVDDDSPTAEPGAKKQVLDESYTSPLNPNKSVYLCTFSPCIEQVTRTVSMMRQLGWMDIEMVEIANKRIHVLREKIGLTVATDRGMAQSPADVNEAMERLRKIEDRVREHQKAIHDPDIQDPDEYMRETYDPAAATALEETLLGDGGSVSTAGAPSFMQGRLVTRTESDVRTHTSYLTFAVLPRDWTAEDEAAAFERWPCGRESKVIGSLDKAARKQEKRDMLEAKRKKKSAGKQQTTLNGEGGGGGGTPSVEQSGGEVKADVDVVDEQEKTSSQQNKREREGDGTNGSGSAKRAKTEEHEQS